jgi:cytoskeletal protein CcmA (bactofilin family)
VSALAFAVLLVVTVGWVVLPLIPALRELRRPTDADPLSAVGHDAGDLTVFAQGFRDYLARHLPSTAADPVPAGAVAKLGDGTSFVMLDQRVERLREIARVDGAIPHIVVATAPLILPGGETFLLEVLAREAFTGGPGAVYRALLAEQDASLGERSVVLRWAHADGALRVGAGSTLYGRASAGATLRLGSGVTFRRVGARCVVAGMEEIRTPIASPPLLAGTAKLPEGARREHGHTRIDGDFTLAPDSSVSGSLLVTGTLRVKNGARVGGSVKTHGDCVLGDDVTIDGALVARGHLTVGARCIIGGPAIAERNAHLGEDSTIGGPDRPASLAARRIVLARGACVYGAVSARETAIAE